MWTGVKFDISWVGMARSVTGPVAQAVREMVPGVLIIAEGVETAAEAENVTVWADLCQGYFWGRPGVPRRASL